MYTPPFNTVHDEDEIRTMVAVSASAWFVTIGDGGTPEATLLPIMWRGSTVIAHMAKANPQWKHIRPDARSLLIVPGPEAYISPSWYAAKTEHGKVVPTWNYTAVHLSGTVRVHEELDWVRAAVTELTDTHEQGRDHPWQVTDAPSTYIDGQLNGIVGLEMAVDQVEGKSKLSQNRSDADQSGVIDGLAAEPGRGAHDIAAAMSSVRRSTAT